MLNRVWADYSLFIVLFISFLSFLTIWALLNPVYTTVIIWLVIIISLLSISAPFVMKYVRLSSFFAIDNLLSKDMYVFAFLCILTVLPRLIYSFLIYPFPLSGDEEGFLTIAGLIASRGLFNYFDFRFFSPWNVRTRMLKHPPLFVIFLSVFFYVFGYDYHIARLIVTLLSSIPVFVTFLIGKELFERKIGIFSAILFSCFPHYFLLSLFTSIDLFLTVFYVTSIYFFIRFVNSGEKTRDLIFFTSVTSLGLLVKYTMIFIYPTLFFALLLEKKTSFLKNWKVWLGGILPLVVLGCWAGILWYNGLLGRVLRNILGYFMADYTQVSTIQSSASVPVFLVYFFLGLGFVSAIISLGGVGYDLRGIIKNNALLFSWSFVPTLFILFVYRLCRYLIPVYPGFAILCAMTILKFVKGKNEKYSIFFLCILSSVAVLSIWTFAGLYVVAEAHHIQYYTGLANYPAGLR